MTTDEILIKTAWEGAILNPLERQGHGIDHPHAMKQSEWTKQRSKSSHSQKGNYGKSLLSGW